MTSVAHQKTFRQLLPSALLLTLWAALLFALFGHLWHHDMSAVYFAGWFYAEGNFDAVYASRDRFYGGESPQVWVDAAAAVGHPGQPVFAYLYPPLWAALVSPFVAEVDPQAFFAVTYGIQVVLLCLSVLLAYGVMGQPCGRLPWVLLSILLLSLGMPGISALQLNQVQITVTFLVLLFAERLIARRDIQAGAALAFAAALKLSPVVLVLILLVERRWKALWSFMAVGLGLGLASLVIAGPALHRDFLDQLATFSNNIQISGINHSPKSLVLQLLDGGNSVEEVREKLALAEVPGWLNGAGTVIFMALCITALLAIRSAPDAVRIGRMVAAIMIAAALTAPISWIHHFLLPLLLLPGLVGFHRPWVVFAVVIAFLAILSRPTFDVLEPAAPFGLLLVALSVVFWLAVYALFLTTSRATAPSQNGRVTLPE